MASRAQLLREVETLHDLGCLGGVHCVLLVCTRTHADEAHTKEAVNLASSAGMGHAWKSGTFRLAGIAIVFNGSAGTIAPAAGTSARLDTARTERLTTQYHSPLKWHSSSVNPSMR